MRLTREQPLAILETVSRRTGSGSTVYQFGSRLDDRTTGGDVDLLIETDIPLTLIERAQIKLELETESGLPVDILAQGRQGAPTPFQRIARAQATRWEVRA